MNKSLLLEVKYVTKDGRRDEFYNEIVKNKIAELSSAENGNFLYEYSYDNKDNILNLLELWENEDAQNKHKNTQHFKILSSLKEKYVEDTIISKNDGYMVRKVSGKVNGLVTVPGSKSMTNRALLLAALSKEDSHLSGVLFSDDSRHFLSSLEILGYNLKIDEYNKMVDIQGTCGNIPNKSATIDVGSAGTAARFLTAMLALSDGQYTINCSEQMKKRPMSALFEVLEKLGAEFTYLEKQGYLPVKVRGNGGICKDADMDISKSTQFLSALLMVAPMTKEGMNINIVSERKDGAYIHITRDMLKEFGVNTEFDGNIYHIEGNQNVNIGDYYIEPDVSAACYFYAIAALTGGQITVRNIYKNSVQGDIQFVHMLEKMGCKIEENSEGICVTGPKDGIFDGIDIDMKDFSDQALTLAAMAPFARTHTVIRNVGHIRGQECDRMAAIINELTKIGCVCHIENDDIFIEPINNRNINNTVIETYDDHRVAMSFTLIGLIVKGIIIKDPCCCRKTFENYYDVLEDLLDCK